MAKKQVKSKLNKISTHKKIASKPKEEFFVSMSEPVFVKQALLESRKNSLEAMKLLREIKEIRKEKHEQKVLLGKSVRQISAAIIRLKSSIPHIEIPREELYRPRKQATEHVPSPKQQPQTIRKAKLSELERIEMQLKDVEDKLVRLA